MQSIIILVLIVAEKWTLTQISNLNVIKSMDRERQVTVRYGWLVSDGLI